MVNYDIDEKEVYRYLGFHEGQHKLTKNMQDLVESCIVSMKNIAQERMIYTPFLDIVKKDDKTMIDTMELIGTDIMAHLKHCDRAVLMAVTIGNQVDATLRKYEAIDMTKAVIMDAVSNVLVEKLADICENEIRMLAKENGLYLTGRYSPGYGDMPISSQKDLLNILSAERRAGITLTPTNLMIPRKSITAVLGLADIPVTGKRAGCNHCIMKDKCEYRKRGMTCD